MNTPKAKVTIGSAQRFAMLCAIEELLNSLGPETPTLEKYQMLGAENPSMFANWRSGIRPIAPKYLALFYEASSKKDRRFLCTDAQKKRMQLQNRDQLPADSVWPSISEQELEDLQTEYRPKVPPKFHEKAEGAAQPNQTRPRKSLVTQKPAVAAPKETSEPEGNKKANLTEEDMADLLKALYDTTPHIGEHPLFRKLARSYGYKPASAVPEEAAKLFMQLPNGKMVDVQVADLSLSALTTLIHVVRLNAERIAQGTHTTVKAKEAKENKSFLRALLMIVGVLETLKMPVPSEFTDMMRQLYGSAIMSTTTKTGARR